MAAGIADYSKAVTKSALQERLLSAVKECQRRFGGKQEVATEDDDTVSQLCVEWEAIMMHGLPCGKGKSRRLALTKPKEAELGFWTVVKENLSQSELERIQSLHHVNTDIGYGRAWLRCSINERSLENYLHQILSNVPLLELHYEKHAYLLDEERSAMLTNMAAGLTSIIFSINYDCEMLNHIAGTHSPPEVVHLPAVEESTATNTQEFKVVSVRKKKKKSKKHEADEEEAQVTPEPEDQIIRERPSDISEDNVLQLESNHSSRRNSSAHSSFSGDVDESIQHSMVALSQPESSDTEGDIATSQAQLAYQTTEMVIKATNEGMNHTGGHNIRFSSEMRTNRTSSVGHSHSPSELKQALLAMVRRKEEMEKERDEVKLLLEQERRHVSELVGQVSGLQAEVSALKEDYQNKEEALKRENAVLRDQLKKYVSLVQAQRKETMTKQTSSEELGATKSPSSQPITELGATKSPVSSPRQSPTPDNPTDYLPNLYSKTIEHKMAEMAEMYGELMELNDRLHRELAEKEAIVQRLSQQLQSRGISLSGVPPSLARTINRSFNQQQQPLVHISIPSVIKRGRGADSHHVYQVYIKVNQEEWNVYRRYAEFNEFHKQIRKVIPEAGTFEFPPKKTIGKKSIELVEGRRLKLQEYLRFVIHLCSTPAGKRPVYIRPAITKQKFIKILPFFREDLTPISEANTPTSPSYSGL